MKKTYLFIKKFIFLSFFIFCLFPLLEVKALEINAGSTGLPGATGTPKPPSGSSSSSSGSSSSGSSSNKPNIVNMDGLNDIDTDNWLNDFEGPPSNVPFGFTWTGPSGQKYVLENTGVDPQSGLSTGAWVPIGSSSSGTPPSTTTW